MNDNQVKAVTAEQVAQMKAFADRVNNEEFVIQNTEEALEAILKHTSITEEQADYYGIGSPLMCETDDPWDEEWCAYEDKDGNILPMGSDVGFILTDGGDYEDVVFFSGVSVAV